MDLFNTFILLVLFGSLSFLFSGIEAGFLALNPVRIRRLARSKYHLAEKLKNHLEEPESFLWTILIGNTIANFIVVALIVFLLRQHTTLAPLPMLVLCLAILFAFYTFFDLLPKMLVRRFPNRLTVLLTYPFELFAAVLAPVIHGVSVIRRKQAHPQATSPSAAAPFQNRDDLQQIMQNEATNLHADERVLIDRVLNLQNKTIRSAMKPFDPKLAVSPHCSLKRAMELCRQQARTRILIREQNGPSFKTIGIFHLKQALFADAPATESPVLGFGNTVLALSQHTVMDEALQQMKAAGQRIAIVTGPNHQELGVISLNDVLRNIFTDVTL